MVSSLEECDKLRAKGVPVVIRREVRYYAAIGREQYVLSHDWTTEVVEEKIWNQSATPEREAGDDAVRTDLAAHRAVFDAAKGLSRLMDEVERDASGQNDRVFAHFEFDQLRYAIGLVENLKGAATTRIEGGSE